MEIGVAFQFSYKQYCDDEKNIRNEVPAIDLVGIYIPLKNINPVNFALFSKSHISSIGMRKKMPEMKSTTQNQWDKMKKGEKSF